jgi:phage-related minor tail protein
MATTSDLTFRVGADLADIKKALADLRAQFKATGAGAGDAVKPASAQLDAAARSARSAADETERLARQQEAAAARVAAAQEREARRAAQAQEREARRAAVAQARVQEQAQRESARSAARAAELQRRQRDSETRQETARQRQLAPQLTDIAVGLATGQSPFMVLLQQGGQLKDLFGGIVPAVKAVGGAVAAVINPITIFAGAVAAIAIGYIKGADEGARFRRIVIDTGAVAGVTAAELDAMAQSLSGLSGSTRSSAAATLAEVAQSGRFAGEQIRLVARAAEQLRNGAGRDVSATVAEFAKIAEDPVRGVDELNRRYGFLTGTLAEQIRTLKQQGREQEASTVAMRAYAAAVDERTPKIRENLGLVERAWRAIKEGTRAAGDALLNVGRDADPQTVFDDLIRRRDELQAKLDRPDAGGRRRATTQRELEDVKARIVAMANEQIKAQQDANKAAAQKRAVAAQEELAAEAQQFESSQQRLAREKERVINRATDAITEAQIAADKKAEDNIAAARDARLAAIAREAAKTPAAVAQANASLVRDDTERSIAELQRLYDRGLLGAEQFFARRRDLQLKATDAEIAAQRAELATTQEPADFARIGAQIRTLERKKADIRRDAIRDETRATQALEESLLEVSTGIQKRGADRSLAVLQESFERADISTAEYYAARQALEEAAIEQDLALARKRLQSQELSPADRARLIAEEFELQQQRSDARRRAITEAERAEKDTRRTLDQARAQQLDAQGNTVEATRLRLELQWGETLKRLEADGKVAGVAIIRGVINAEVAKAELDKIRELFDQTAGGLQSRLAEIADRQRLGVISPAQARDESAAERQQALADLQALNAKLQEMANAPDALPAVKRAAQEAAAALRQMAIEGATGVEAAMIELRQALAETEASFAKTAVSTGVDALTTFFTDIATGSKSAGDALKDFVRSFAASMAQIAARALATFLVLQALDAIYPGLGKATAAVMGVGVKHSGGMAGTGPRRQVSPLLFAGAPRYHDGGMVGIKPDERPAILQTGEEVLSRSDPRNRANGGAGSGYRIVNVLDPALVSSYLESAAGERTVLNVIGRNPGSVRQLIGS